MYVLIIAIHAVFITTTHLLGYRIFEGIFILLCVFFLFYFSPLFFLDEEKKDAKKMKNLNFVAFFTQISPKDSLLIPITLLYIALYGFVFSIFGTSYAILPLHATIVIVIYVIFIGYMLSFLWKHDVFFEIFRFHTLFTAVSSIITLLSLIFIEQETSFLHPFLGILAGVSGTFLLSYTKKENIFFLSTYSLSLYTTLGITLYYFFPSIGVFAFLIVATIFSFIFFEIFPKQRIFMPYITFFQYFSLGTIIIILPIIVYFAFLNIQAVSVVLLFLIALFFLSIHVRYANYIVFILSILDIFFLYSLLFSGLLSNPTITSFFLFIFFLPILIIGTTFFWEESHLYDFMILHYASIIFSIAYSLYGVFFLPWGSDFLFIISLCIFGIALLFFMSYFRFRSNKPPLS